MRTHNASCGQTYQTLPSPVMSKSIIGSKTSGGWSLNKKSTIKHTQFCFIQPVSISDLKKTDILFDMAYNVVCYIVYDICYDITQNSARGKNMIHLKKAMGTLPSTPGKWLLQMPGHKLSWQQITLPGMSARDGRRKSIDNGWPRTESSV